MPRSEAWKTLRQKVDALFADFSDDLPIVGEAAAEAIVRTTLAGIADGDQAFAPYSPAYQELIEAVGGKPSGVVNLRGVFYATKRGRKVTKTSLSKGQGRRAFLWITVAGRTFLIRTRQTRPQKGLIDKNSEMSLDLIRIVVHTRANRITLIYTPRAKDYMIHHQATRKWFSTNKQAVKDGAIETMRILLEARVMAFNSGGGWAGMGIV